MVLTGNQITSFFEYGEHMVLSKRTQVFLQEEVITIVADLVDFIEDYIWRQFINNYKRHPRVTPAGGGAFVPRNHSVLQKN